MNGIYKIGDSVMLYNGDCIEVMKTLPDDSVDAIVTDPPYELGFMGKKWDNTGIANSVEMWKECLRVLKPGGHVLSFGGTRTYHRMACAIEDAGFEIRDQMQWLYGSGFPKSMSIGKAVDKLQGNEREVVGSTTSGRILRANGQNERPYQQGKDKITTDITKGNSEWEGWGTCLKPAHEPICLARKPISEKTIADNVLKWGTGGINIDDCRIGYEEGGTAASNPLFRKQNGYKTMCGNDNDGTSYKIKPEPMEMNINANGRFPSNIILDEEAGKILDAQSGAVSYGSKAGGYTYSESEYEVQGFIKKCKPKSPSNYGDGGGASRFFYCPKASKSERNAGINSKNNHPTVKPVKLMEYLIKLVTPPNGVVLDPFTGSGSTGIAARNLGFRFVGIEKEKEYCEIAEKRISHVQGERQLSILGDAI